MAKCRKCGGGRAYVDLGVDGHVDPPLLLWSWLSEVGGQVPEVRGGQAYVDLGVDGHVALPLLLWTWRRYLAVQEPDLRGCEVQLHYGLVMLLAHHLTL